MYISSGVNVANGTIKNAMVTVANMGNITQRYDMEFEDGRYYSEIDRSVTKIMIHDAHSDIKGT